MYNVYNSEKEGLLKLKNFTDDAIKKGYTVIGLSASGDEAKQQLKSDYTLNFDTYLCDEKVVKTIVRANPGIFILKKGTVVNKSHWNDIEAMELKDLPESERDIIEKEGDGTAFLIDGKISSEEESKTISKDDILEVFVYKETEIAQKKLDSINSINNTYYTSLIEILLKEN